MNTGSLCSKGCCAELEPVKTVDIRGAACGMSVAKANLTIRGIEEGQVLEVIAEGCGSSDIQVWTRATGHKLVAVREEAGLTKLYVRKGSRK